MMVLTTSFVAGPLLRLTNPRQPGPTTPLLQPSRAHTKPEERERRRETDRHTHSLSHTDTQPDTQTYTETDSNRLELGEPVISSEPKLVKKAVFVGAGR